MTLTRQATPSDVPALLPLVADYWSFEGIPGFEAQRVAVQLKRLLSEPTRGAGWIAVVEGVAAGYLLAVYVFSLETGASQQRSTSSSCYSRGAVMASAQNFSRLPNLSSCGFNVQTSRFSCHGLTTLRWCSTDVGDTLKS